MRKAEALRFEARPNLRWILALRSWDEQAKDPSAHPPELEAYRERLRTHLEAERAGVAPC